MNIGSDGKPVLKILDLDYVSDIYIGAVSDKTAGASGASAEPAPESPAQDDSKPAAEPAPSSGRSNKK